MQFFKVTNRNELREIITEKAYMFSYLHLMDGELEKYIDKILTYGASYVVKKNDANLGFIIFYCNNIESEEAYISLIAVDENVRGQNIGKKMIQKCVDISKERGMKKIKLEVNNENKNAIIFYQKMGFYFTGEITNESKYMMLDI